MASKPDKTVSALYWYDVRNLPKRLAHNNASRVIEVQP